LLYASCVAMGCSLAAGLLPALRSTAVSEGLKLDAHQTSDSARRFPLRSWLVAGQLAVSVLLLTAGLLFLRNLLLSRDMNVGFDVDRSIWARVNLVPERYASEERVRAMIKTATERLRSAPGVDAASLTRNVPFNGSTHNGVSVQADGRGASIHVTHFTNMIAPDYFSTMGIPLVYGRDFLASDREGAPAVAILNESFARRMFGNVNPVGRRLFFAYPKGPFPIEIVGVARDSKYFTLGEKDALALYRPLDQVGQLPRELDFMIRAHGAPEALLREVNTRLTELDESAAVEVRTMRNSLGFALLPSRAGAALLGSMGALALLLASVGLYGVLAYTVSRRTREIGVRIAMGASQGRVLRMVLLESGILIGVGLAIGLAISFLATRPLAAFLVPDLRPADPASFAGAVLTLGLIGIIASAAPAWRAMRVDPIAALREE
jgi:putative ABC transport system permease protein